MCGLSIPCSSVTGSKNSSEPEYLEDGRGGSSCGSEDGGSLPKNWRPTRDELNPPRGTLGEQAQEQADEAGNHGEVLGTSSMTRRVLMCTSRRSGRGGRMLRRVPCAISALRRIADQVQGPEGTVAEEQRAGEQHGQLPDVKQLHR